MKKPFELGFASAADLLARAVDHTLRDLAATGFVCDVHFTVAVRTELAAKRASDARTAGLRTGGASSTAPTEPALAAWLGRIGGVP